MYYLHRDIDCSFGTSNIDLAVCQDELNERASPHGFSNDTAELCSTIMNDNGFSLPQTAVEAKELFVNLINIIDLM